MRRSAEQWRKSAFKFHAYTTQRQLLAIVPQIRRQTAATEADDESAQ